MRILNVGAGPASTPMPPYYQGHTVERLDIDPRYTPQLLMDVRDVGTLPRGAYDVAYCSHILEHFYTHEAERIVHGLYHILADDGVCDVMLPNIGALLEQGSLDLDRVMYQSPAGPITVHDMLYGFSGFHRASEHPEYQTHRSAWSAHRLGGLLNYCGFSSVFAGEGGLDLRVVGFKREPSAERMAAFGLAVAS